MFYSITHLGKYTQIFIFFVFEIFIFSENLNFYFFFGKDRLHHIERITLTLPSPSSLSQNKLILTRLCKSNEHHTKPKQRYFRQRCAKQTKRLQKYALSLPVLLNWKFDIIQILKYKYKSRII